METEERTGRALPALLPRSGWHWAILVALAVFVVAAMGANVHHAWTTQPQMLDLQVYRAGGQALLDEFPLYQLKYKVASLPFTYTPFAALVFVPFARLEPWAADALWTLLSGLALVRLCFLTARLVRERSLRSWSLTELTLLLLGAGLAAEPTIATIEFGQVNIIAAWLVVEDLLARRRRWWSGALIGLATGIKLVPGIFIVFLLLTRRTKEAATAAGVFALTVVAGFLVQPDQAWQYWTGIAYDPSRVGGVAYVSNQSLNGAITRLTHPGGNRPVWAVLAAVTVVVALWTARRLWTAGLQLPAISTVALCMLLVSPVSWSHHWVWVVVFLGALADPRFGPWPVRWALIVTTGAVFMSGVIWTVPNTHDLEYAHHGWQIVRANAYTELAIVLISYGAAMAWLLGRSARPPRDTGTPVAAAASST